MELEIIGIASDKVKDLLSIDRTELLLFANYSHYNIPLYHTFNFYRLSKSEKWKECEAQLKYITQEWGKSYDEIPIGHKTLCIVEIKSNINEFKELDTISTWMHVEISMFFSDSPI